MPGRIELKYLISHDVKAGLLQRWQKYLDSAPFTDDQAVYPILSLYFDSPSLRFYDEKVDGEMLRNKVRLRGYGYRWEKMDPCFLEVKRKVDTRIIKFRKNMGRFRPEFLHPAGWQLAGSPEADRVSALLERYRLRPAVQVFYLREAYESPLCQRLRITVDSTLVALHPGEPLQRHMLIEPQRQCIRDTQFVLEIKSNGALPRWITDAIREFQIEQRAFSKYVVCIEKLGIQNREIGVYA
jgi:hypothetical protein